MATRQIWLRFFDVDLRLQIDSAEYLHRFLTLYDHFILPNRPDPPAPTQLNYTIVIQTATPYTILNGVRRRLPSKAWIVDYLYNDILQTTFAHVSSHLLFHAGVVSQNGRGIMIVADSFHGKTTLVMRLVRQGFLFLGDETAAIGLDDRLLQPCLRRLNVRAGTLQLAGYTMDSMSTEIGDRLIVDLPALQPNCAGDAVSLDYLFVLEDSERQVDSTRLMVVVDHLPQAIKEALEALSDVVAIQVTQLTDCVRLYIHTRQQLATFNQLEALCESADSLILDVQVEETHRPNFRTPVTLRKISSSDAALALLQRFQGGYKSHLITKRFSGNAAQLYFETWQRIAHAHCYALQVGDLETMVATICQAAEC